VVLSVLQAVWLLGAMAGAPGDFLVGSHIHPDNLANQWLLPWAVDTALSGGELMHTTAYYWPVGDAPLLSGDGTQALLYSVFHVVVGWPSAVPLYVGLVLVLNGLSGWLAARWVSGSGMAALVAVPVCGASPFVLMELSAGRFSQAAVWPLWLFLGVWWRYLVRPGPGLAVLSAGVLFYTTFSYWYYGWFGVLAGALMWLAMRREHPAAERWTHWRWHGLFSAVFLVLLAPLAWRFFVHWSAVPGSGETTVFPPESASFDRLPLLPVLLPGDPNTTAALQSVVALVLAGVGVARGDRPARSWALVGVVFLMLGWGPAFSGAPYTTLYGLAAPLRRFWWPVRHVVLVHGAVGVLAAVAVARLSKHPGWGVVGALGVWASLWVQGAPGEVERTPLVFPPDGYAQLANLPGGPVLAFPLAPEATGTNDAMLHQLAHGHPMVTGHSPWVARARPAEWDAWVAETGLLARMADLERAGWAGGSVTVTAADVQAVQDSGVRWLVLDRTLVPLSLKGMVRAHDALLDAVFGRPVVRTSDVQVWDVSQAKGAVTVDLPAWKWPAGIRPAGPEHPLSARRPESPMLGTPSGAVDRHSPNP